jgi:5-methylcytosine-specific restriction endonuclease McrA
MIKYYTSTGERVSQATINVRRAKSYIENGYGVGSCAGCGKLAQGRAHTIAQARCKHLSKTELIWNPANFWPSCHECNSLWESYKNKDVTKLFNYALLLEFVKQHDLEGYQKRINWHDN